MLPTGAPGWLSGLRPLPSAQVMIPESWDRAPHQALCSAGSLLLPLPPPLPTAHALLLSPSQINKYNLFLKRLYLGVPGWLSGLKPLPSAQVLISGCWDRAPHQALCSAGSLLLPLPLPASLPTCDLCQINKSLKKFLSN